MSTPSPHNRIINSTARTKLKPLGILQKGRSRLWHDDRHWHVISIEFQPSGFSKGSYLNVGISWLWYRKEHLSFDLPYEARPWVEFHNETQFQHDFEALADQAIEAIGDLRASASTLNGSYERVLEMNKELPRRASWPDVHLGLLAALVGQLEQANELLRFVADEGSTVDWRARQKAFCETAITLLGSVDDLRAWVEQNIAECRSLLRLPSFEAPVLPSD